MPLKNSNVKYWQFWLQQKKPIGIGSAHVFRPGAFKAKVAGSGGSTNTTYSSSEDAIIQSYERTLRCLYNDPEMTFDWSQNLNMQSIGGPIQMGDCNLSDPLPSQEAVCACEQSIYHANLDGHECYNYNIQYWYHPDYLGSVEFVTDCDGEAYQFFLNTPWGENLESHSSYSYKSFDSRYRFNGKELDPETGNYYYGARYYDPQISIWLSVDPLAVLSPNLTPYRFSFNNPINVVDPDGLYEDPKSAQKAQQKSKDKLGEDRVSDVYYDPQKEEYAFRVYDEGEDKYTHEVEGEEGSVMAYQGHGIYNNKNWNKYKSDNGLFTPFVASASWSFVFGGGASFTYGLVQDKYGKQRTFHTWGGGVGFEGGGSFNYGLIKEKEGYDFHVEDFEGLGFEYGGGIGPFSIKNAGNTGRHGFEFSGRDYDVIQGSGSPEGIGAILKALSKAKFKVGGSYQWNKTTLH